MKKGRDPIWEAKWAMTRFSRLVRNFSTRFPVVSDYQEEAGDPPVDVFERQTEYMIELEAPGLSREDIQISVDGNLLRIEGYKKRSRDQGCLRFLCLEREFGYFRRIVELPGSFDTRGTEAYMSEGVLIIKLPKLMDRRETRVKILISD